MIPYTNGVGVFNYGRAEGMHKYVLGGGGVVVDIMLQILILYMIPYTEG